MLRAARSFSPSLVQRADSDIALDSTAARQSVVIANGGGYLSLGILLPAHAIHSTEETGGRSSVSDVAAVRSFFSLGILVL